MIDYRKKLTTHRKFNSLKDINVSAESDRGRIILAPSFRRLQRKTQVFPLELNAAVRNRLTHSLEVSQNARYIAKTILKKLGKEKIFECGLSGLEDVFISVSEMTSLLHDIGNPPFGHFAEIAINNWIKTKGRQIFNESFLDNKYDIELKDILLKDISNFDGNAQAIRVITKLQRLNLSYTQIASVIKYTKMAGEINDSDKEVTYLRKKPGYYYSEKNIVKEVKKKLEMNRECRFPITYIMEAADDISYLTADIEDSVDKKILTFENVYNLIVQECNRYKEDYLIKIVNKFYKNAKKEEAEPHQFNLFLTLTRVTLVTDLVNYVSEVYINNHRKIFDGSFNSSLLEFDENNKYTKAVKILQKISTENIYNNKISQTLELKGHKILTSLLDAYSPLLKLKTEEFKDLANNKKSSCYVSNRLIERLSKKHLISYKTEIEELEKNNKNYELLEWYYRTRLVIDYIAGMTDDFAYNEYKELNALII